MKKIFYAFICLMLFVGCDNLTLRKDKNEKITFNNLATHGSYDIYVYDLDYPEEQNEKIIFLNKFKDLLKEGRDKNFLISKELNEDLNSILKEEGVGIERTFFKSAAFINNYDKKIINKNVKNIKTPKNAGSIQEYLNKQYYYILTLIGKEAEYNKDFYYSEFDKEKIIKDYLKNRTELKELIIKNKKNFVIKMKDVDEIKNTDEKIIYLNLSDINILDNIVEKEKNLNSSIVILNNNKYTGYVASQNNLILFSGNGKIKLNSFIGYDFNVKIIKSNKVKLLTNVKQLEISDLISRNKYIPKRPLDV